MITLSQEVKWPLWKPQGRGAAEQVRGPLKPKSNWIPRKCESSTFSMEKESGLMRRLTD